MMKAVAQAALEGSRVQVFSLKDNGYGWLKVGHASESPSTRASSESPATPDFFPKPLVTSAARQRAVWTLTPTELRNQLRAHNITPPRGAKRVQLMRMVLRAERREQEQEQKQERMQERAEKVVLRGAQSLRRESSSESSLHEPSGSDAEQEELSDSMSRRREEVTWALAGYFSEDKLLQGSVDVLASVMEKLSLRQPAAEQSQLVEAIQAEAFGGSFHGLAFLAIGAVEVEEFEFALLQVYEAFGEACAKLPVLPPPTAVKSSEELQNNLQEACTGLEARLAELQDEMSTVQSAGPAGGPAEGPEKPGEKKRKVKQSTEVEDLTDAKDTLAAKVEKKESEATSLKRESDTPLKELHDMAEDKVEDLTDAKDTLAAEVEKKESEATSLKSVVQPQTGAGELSQSVVTPKKPIVRSSSESGYRSRTPKGPTAALEEEEAFASENEEVRSQRVKDKARPSSQGSKPGKGWRKGLFTTPPRGVSTPRTQRWRQRQAESAD